MKCLVCRKTMSGELFYVDPMGTAWGVCSKRCRTRYENGEGGLAGAPKEADPVALAVAAKEEA